MFQPNGRGVSHSFLFGDVGCAPWEKRLGTELHYDEMTLLDAVIFTRENGPIHLRQLSIEKIRSLLTDFVSEHYSLLADDTFIKFFNHSYLEEVSESSKEKFANALQGSEIFNPNISLTLFPLDALLVEKPFKSQSFFLASCEDVRDGNIEIGFDVKHIDPMTFPPVFDSSLKKSKPKSWLGVWSPSQESAVRTKNAVLGSLALTINFRARYIFTGRKIIQGSCTLGDSISCSFNATTTPPLGDDTHINSDDFAWLSLLASKLNEISKDSRREIRALEYFYASWFLDESERYPALYMSLESIFGDANRATQAVIDSIRDLIGMHIPEQRIRALSDLRAAVVHGGSPQVYDSSKYAKYYRKYRDDPIRDLAVLTAECLRKKIYNGCIYEKSDPNEAFIKKAVESGRMPPLKNTSILDGE